MKAPDNGTLDALLRLTPHTRTLRRHQVAFLLDLSPGYFGAIWSGRYRPPYWTESRICDFFLIEPAEFARRFEASARVSAARRAGKPNTPRRRPPRAPGTAPGNQRRRGAPRSSARRGRAASPTQEMHDE